MTDTPRSHRKVTVETPAEEPTFAHLRMVTMSGFASELDERLPTRRSRSAIVAIDGRSGSGKTTLAHRLRALLPGTVVVGTDDLAWHHSFFGWTDLLVDGVLAPLRAGRGVEYRPPAWRERGRPGSITVPSDAKVVLVEGVGAARRETAALIDVVIWVQSDFEQAKRRCIERESGRPSDLAFWRDWMNEELPFFASERTWERAHIVVVNDDRLTASLQEYVTVTDWRSDVPAPVRPPRP